MNKTISELYDGCRSYRRFKQKKIPVEILEELVETARKRSSGMNAQPLRYIVVKSPEKVSMIQPHIHWAAKLPKEIGTPRENELPTAFIIILTPIKTNPITSIDTGIVLDTMAITAWQHGVGSCIINAVNREDLKEIISIPEDFTIGPVLALGYPLNKSTIVEADDEHGLDYYVDDNRDYYVPKRSADEIITYI